MKPYWRKYWRASQCGDDRRATVATASTKVLDSGAAETCDPIRWRAQRSESQREEVVERYQKAARSVRTYEDGAIILATDVRNCGIRDLKAVKGEVTF